MTHTFHHPKYYKNLRKLARLRNRDQAISDNDSTESRERAPGTGQSDSQVVNQVELSSQSQASSSKPQASSVRPQALKLSNQPQASSAKRQASQPE